MSKLIPIPESISEQSQIRGTTLVRSWRKGAVQLAFLTLFCIGWNAILIFWYSMAFSTNAPWIMKVFPIGHLGVGIGLTYYLLAIYLNKTEISIDSGQLLIRSHPIPWRGNKSINASSISQLYVSERSRSDSYGRFSKNFELHMIDKSNRQSLLLKGLDTAQEALYLEKRLEKLLNLEDTPVAGAYTG